jgi:anti-anti-sigma factor
VEISFSQNQDSPDISIMKLQGALDGASYEYFITEAQKLYDTGIRNLLLDMSELTFLSSAGIAALHRIARVFRGEDRAIMEEGWSAIHSISKDQNSSAQEHIKLLNPGENILAVLDTVGLQAFFEIFTDIHPAMASFQ